MPVQRSLWLTVTQLLVAAPVFVCACSHITDAASSPPVATSFTLALADGTDIAAESLRCIYRQSTGASDELSLQLQYLSAPDSVAFALYVTDPKPAKPFLATPQDTGAFDFEAIVDEQFGYRSQRDLSEISIYLDELPPPSALRAGETVKLHGQLELEELSLAAVRSDQSETLRIAAGSVPIDCDAVFQQEQVLN